MAWWSGLWLNEGFACFMQTWAADSIFPEWKLWDQFVTDDLSAALRLDSLRSSHPIQVQPQSRTTTGAPAGRHPLSCVASGPAFLPCSWDRGTRVPPVFQVPIKHAEEVEEVFDAISYCKGACVIRMLNAVLGEEAFRKGLQVYMKVRRGHVAALARVDNVLLSMASALASATNTATPRRSTSGRRGKRRLASPLSTSRLLPSARHVCHRSLLGRPHTRFPCASVARPFCVGISLPPGRSRWAFPSSRWRRPAPAKSRSRRAGFSPTAPRWSPLRRRRGRSPSLPRAAPPPTSRASRRSSARRALRFPLRVQARTTGCRSTPATLCLRASSTPRPC